MRITSFSHGDNLLGWEFQEVNLKNLSLFVGESASGKSLMLTSLFRIATKVVSDQQPFVGHWKFRFEIAGIAYEWELDSPHRDNLEVKIAMEKLIKFNPDGSPTVLVDRTYEYFKLKDKEVPKMPGTSTSIFLFREDPDLKPIHEGFKRIMLRDFVGDQLNNAFAVQATPRNLLESFKKEKNFETIFHLDLSISLRLFILKEHFKDRYKSILDAYREVFPFVEQFEFKDMSTSGELLSNPGKMPYLHIKDRNSGTLVPAQNLSSGMKKVLLIMTDVLSLPLGVIYLIDEYENSLGLNAINFLPNLIAEHGGDNQFIITTHHPYLINAIPVNNWIVFHRKGLQVSVKQGDDLAESYGKSKQQSFIKLINDPFFTEGAL